MYFFNAFGRFRSISDRGDLPCLFSGRFHCTTLYACRKRDFILTSRIRSIARIRIRTAIQPSTIHPSVRSSDPLHSISRHSDSIAIPIPAHTKMPPASKRDTLSAVLLSSLLHLRGAPFSFPPFILRRFASYFY